MAGMKPLHRNESNWCRAGCRVTYIWIFIWIMEKKTNFSYSTHTSEARTNRHKHKRSRWSIVYHDPITKWEKLCIT